MEELHMSLQPYRVSANNTAKASENKIHDDATARRFGFTGGLVGGVHVYAYMTHLPVASLGPCLAGARHRRLQVRASRSMKATSPRSLPRRRVTA